jgi:hypothetical protein
MKLNNPRAVSGTQRRTRARRLKLQVLLVAALVAAGLFTVTMPWYTMGLPQQTIRDSQLNEVTNVSAVASITGLGLVHQAPPTQFASMGDPTLTAPHPGAMLGLPQPAFFLLLLGVAVVAGALLRFGFIAGIGVVAGVFGWKQLNVLRSVVEDPNFGGSLNHPAAGLTWFQLSLAVAVFAAAAVTLQIVLVNAEERRKAKEAARENGEPVKPTVWETIAALQMSNLSRMLNYPGNVDTAREAASTAHLPKPENSRR